MKFNKKLHIANVYSKKLIVDKIKSLDESPNITIKNIINKAKMDRNFYIRYLID